MSGFIPEEQLERVREATDIVSLVGEYVALKRAGNAFKALCPFHEEKTPSFHVNPQRQIFKCFGCGVGGDAISFVMKHDGMEFDEAVRFLAGRAGVALTTEKGGRQRAARADTVYDVTLWAARRYFEWLQGDNDTARHAREYIADRSISEETARVFGLGYAPDSWDGLLAKAREEDISTDDLVRAGLVVRREGGGLYDRFRNRLMFPIFDVRNRVLGFGARSLDGSEPKYLNSPETRIFKKGRAVYGLKQGLEAMRKCRRVLVVEGYTDVIMAHQQGVENAVAVLGTALTRDHVRLLRRHADEAMLVFDADEAGQASADRSVDAFAAEGMAVRVCRLPEGADPCDFFLEKGAAGETWIQEHASDMVEFKMARAKAAAGGRAGGVGALDGVLRLIGEMPDPSAQDVALRRVCVESGVTLAAAAARMHSVRRRDQRRGDRQRVSTRRDPERELLQVVLAEPACVGTLREGLDLTWIRQDVVRSVLARAMDLADEGVEPHAGELLARTTDPAEREIVEKLLADGLPENVDYAAWCAELVGRLSALHEETQADSLQQNLREAVLDGDAEDLGPEAREALRKWQEHVARRQRKIGLGRAFLKGLGE